MPTWITDAELTQIRAEMVDLMPDTAIIQEVTRTSDGAGGWTESWTAISGGTVICRIDPLQMRAGDVSVIALAENMALHYQGTFPHDAPIGEDRRVVTGGNTYEIVQMDIDHSKRAVRRAILAEVR